MGIAAGTGCRHLRRSLRRPHPSRASATSRTGATSRTSLSRRSSTPSRYPAPARPCHTIAGDWQSHVVQPAAEMNYLSTLSVLRAHSKGEGWLRCRLALSTLDGVTLGSGRTEQAAPQRGPGGPGGDGGDAVARHRARRRLLGRLCGRVPRVHARAARLLQRGRLYGHAGPAAALTAGRRHAGAGSPEPHPMLSRVCPVQQSASCLSQHRHPQARFQPCKALICRL